MSYSFGQGHSSVSDGHGDSPSWFIPVLPRRLILMKPNGKGLESEPCSVVWLHDRGDGQQVGNWRTRPVQPHARQEVTPVFSELEGLKGHVSLQREEIETQTHPGHPSTDILSSEAPRGREAPGLVCPSPAPFSSLHIPGFRKSYKQISAMT